MEEIWKSINDYDGFYEISNLGRVRSIERVVRNRFSFRILKPRVLKYFVDKDGYNIVTLSKKSKTKKIRVGSEVFKTFKHSFTKPHTVDHINKIRTDDSIGNLRVLHKRENSSETSNNKSNTPIGICLRNNSYVVRKSYNGIRKHLGSFKDLKDALNAYNNYKGESI